VELAPTDAKGQRLLGYVLRGTFRHPDYFGRRVLFAGSFRCIIK
jgi:hypothetical protein